MNPTAATGAERLDRPWAGEATSPSASLSTQADEAQHRQRDDDSANHGGRGRRGRLLHGMGARSDRRARVLTR